MYKPNKMDSTVETENILFYFRETQYNSGFPKVREYKSTRLLSLAKQGGGFEKPKYGHGLQMKHAENQQEELVSTKFL